MDHVRLRHLRLLQSLHHDFLFAQRNLRLCLHLSFELADFVFQLLVARQVSPRTLEQREDKCQGRI
jgi:hypothetical protein